MLYSTLLTLSLIAVTIYLGRQKFKHSHKLKSISDCIYKAESAHIEHLLYRQCAQKLARAQAVLESGVGDTTSGVRAMHKSIANIPFSVLEAIPATRDTTKLVRGVHDLISDGVYSAVSAGNQLAGSATRRGLQSTRKKSLAVANNQPKSPKALPSVPTPQPKAPEGKR